ncbi:glycine cleavage system protein GcvH [Acidaminobacter hydrogenoformans]|uniref:Glycine cleavage system H protein n=1 Tax=Acidaminobacter hydrogenoformans DSM 2784 TaxID=1120920 RepID=A0A1G5S4B3_9FIRM|nr:glycine cleavage system protein GcvH [Acidaminobacter hydrogenoformans]SCZ81252.1 glycine cleavage system H protein [Acidaminobacter hydrogenoformans DSM 2784]
MNVVKGLYYSEDHEWVKVEGNKAKLGVTDHAAHQLGDIVYLELPEVGAELSAGDVFGVIESVKAASDSYSPVSGVVTAVNEELADGPEAINSDPYESWIFEIELSDASELEGLMSAEAYEAFIAE